MHQFEALLERMAFLGTEDSDDKMVMNLFDFYSDENGVSLESCQRLLLQVLAGLEINETIGARSKKVERAGEEELVDSLSNIYNERRLLQKPRHHRHLEDQDGLLYIKDGASSPTHEALTESFAQQPTKKTPAFATRRRASTLTSRIRKSTTKDSQKELAEHYACTFKPVINEYSRKLDAQTNKNMKLKGAAPMKVFGESRASMHNLEMESLTSASAYLDKIMRRDGDKKTTINEIRNSFDKVVENNANNETVKERST